MYQPSATTFRWCLSLVVKNVTCRLRESSIQDLEIHRVSPHGPSALLLVWILFPNWGRAVLCHTYFSLWIKTRTNYKRERKYDEKGIWNAIFIPQFYIRKKSFKLYKNDILLCIASFWPFFVIFLNGNTQNGKWNFHWSPFLILQPLFCQIDKLENVAVKSLRE